MLATTRRFAVMASAAALAAAPACAQTASSCGRLLKGADDWPVKSAEGADLDPRETPRVAGWGFGGQRLYIVPALQLVVAITAGLWETGTQDMVVLGILNRYVLRSVRGQ